MINNMIFVYLERHDHEIKFFAADLINEIENIT